MHDDPWPSFLIMPPCSAVLPHPPRLSPNTEPAEPEPPAPPEPVEAPPVGADASPPPKMVPHPPATLPTPPSRPAAHQSRHQHRSKRSAPAWPMPAPSVILFCCRPSPVWAIKPVATLDHVALRVPLQGRAHGGRARRCRGQPPVHRSVISRHACTSLVDNSVRAIHALRRWRD
jgi:hypothetical protein